MSEAAIRVYTDGSCHTQLLLGAWASILFIDKDKIILKGEENETTHNRMELQAVIKAIEYLDLHELQNRTIEVYSDSQYVVNLLLRKEKLKQKKFITNKGAPIQNVGLIKQLIHQIEHHHLNFIKIKAHQKNGDESNREVDKVVRQLVRKAVLNHE